VRGVRHIGWSFSGRHARRRIGRRQWNRLMALRTRRCLHYGFGAIVSAGCGCGRCGSCSDTTTEPQILQLVVEGAGPQVRVLSPPQTGVLTSKRASDRTGLCARMSLRARTVSTGAASGRRCRVLRTLANLRGEPSRALPRQHQLVVWTQIGYSVVNYVIGLLGGEPTSAQVGVGALQRQGL
jgi:hypothetical protein